MKNKYAAYGNFDTAPEKVIKGFEAWQGWDGIRKVIEENRQARVIVAECYPGVDQKELEEELGKLGRKMIHGEQATVSDELYQKKISYFLTEDRVFGKVNTLNYEDFYREDGITAIRQEIEDIKGTPVLIYGCGASLITEGDMLLYFDMPRWEIQCRFKRGMPNWKSSNGDGDKLNKFKQGFFLEWRMADRRKKKLYDKIDYILDTVVPGKPKMVSGEGFLAGIDRFAEEPFRLVPYYAPEVWGGQWMKEVCDLDRREENYAWSFDGVPEENSIYMRFGEIRMEFPSLNVVFRRPEKLLGGRVHARFGDEFPIRFDFLDTMEGQNLSLQVHPLTEYIQNTFGMHYTQDESYYIMDCEEGAVVYLGLKEGIDPEEMKKELLLAKEGNIFPVEKYVNALDAAKHDHFLIPAGTIHCSGKNTMVLEISATPYIFTFKLWDWGRLGLDGRPRPVHTEHGFEVIQWDRTTSWVEENLVNRFETLVEEEGFKEIRTGLHEREFIETRRYHLKKKKEFTSGGSVSMCNLVDGKAALVRSPEGRFEPFEVHYGETFIIPADTQRFTIEPTGEECMILRATVR